MPRTRKPLNPDRRPTDVSVVLDYLVKLDDFAPPKMIRAGTRLPPNRLRPAIAHLHKHRAIDCIIVNGDELWFFATPGDDDRSRIMETTLNGITRKDKGRRSKRSQGGSGAKS